MSKKNKKQPHKKTAKKKSFKWKKYLQQGLIASTFIGLIVGTIVVYGNTISKEFDLSVIGNGKATVVQIHDTNCQLCRRLKGNLNDVKAEFTDNIQFKTANILSAKGKRFADRHRVSHVTLLFFNKQGDRVNTLQGVSSQEEIRQALTSLEKMR